MKWKTVPKRLIAFGLKERQLRAVAPDADDRHGSCFVLVLWILLVPSLLFLQATALVTTNPSAVDSWRDHFFGIRSWFFSVDVVLILHSVTTASLLRGVPLVHPLRALQAIGLTISILGAASASPRLHATIAPVARALQSLGLGSLFFRLQGLG